MKLHIREIPYLEEFQGSGEPSLNLRSGLSRISIPQEPHISSCMQSLIVQIDLMFSRSHQVLAKNIKSSVSHTPCARALLSRSIHRPCFTRRASLLPNHQRATFSTTRMSLFPTPSSDPPKHEMVYFPQMTTSLPSESAEFRRVLWTGLYSQLVLMTVPVGGDIGDEVWTSHIA